MRTYINKPAIRIIFVVLFMAILISPESYRHALWFYIEKAAPIIIIGCLLIYISLILLRKYGGDDILKFSPSTPVEYAPPKEYSIVELGMFYWSSWDSFLAACVVNSWERGDVDLVFSNQELLITLKKIPNNRSQKEFFKLLYNNNQLAIGETVTISDDSRLDINAMTKFRKYMQEFLVSNKLRKKKKPSLDAPLFLFLGLIFLIQIVGKFLSSNPVTLIFIIFVGFFSVAIILRTLMNQTFTARGKKLHDEIVSYRDYLTALGSGRFSDPRSETLSTPHEIDDLPYAILFGLENEWPKYFRNLYVSQKEEKN